MTQELGYDVHMITIQPRDGDYAFDTPLRHQLVTTDPEISPLVPRCHPYQRNWSKEPSQALLDYHSTNGSGALTRTWASATRCSAATTGYGNSFRWDSN